MHHAAGYDIILNTTGRDATEDFEEIGHSNAAREMLDKYIIGDFEVPPLVQLSCALQLLLTSTIESRLASISDTGGRHSQAAFVAQVRCAADR